MAIDWDAEVLSSVMREFGEGALADQSTLPLYTPAGLPSFRLADAVFDREFLLVTTNGEGTDNITRTPVLGVRLALLPREPRQGDKVYIPSVGITFIVRQPEPDGHGHAKLFLQKVAA